MKSKIEVEVALPLQKDDIFLEATKLSQVLPLAPTPERNNEKAVFNSDSPLTWVDHESLDDNAAAAAADLDSSPRTPKAAVFDPFAPGPDDLILAPQVKKRTIKSKIDVVRRLNFEDCKQGEVLDDFQEDIFLDKIYESLLGAIVSKQIQGVLFENKLAFSITPTKMPLLNGIADTCPAAPRKSRSGLKKNDLGLCRKLEF